MRLGRLPISGACSNVENSPKVPVTRPYSKANLVTGDSFKVARYIGTRGKKAQPLLYTHVSVYPAVTLHIHPMPHCMLIIPQKRVIFSPKASYMLVSFEGTTYKIQLCSAYRNLVPRAV